MTISTSLQSIFSLPTRATHLVVEYLSDDQEPAKHKDLLANEYLQRVVYDFFAKRMIENHVSSAVFLDIDGVIYNNGFYSSGAFGGKALQRKADELFPDAETWGSYEMNVASTHFFSQSVVSGLTKLIREIGSVIILSSNLRTQYSVPKIRNIMSSLPFCYAVVDRTPNFSHIENANFDDINIINDRTSKNRGAEISYWLKQHPSIKNFVILDDLDSNLSIFGHRFVKIDSETLATDADLIKAKAILQGSL